MYFYIKNYVLFIQRKYDLLTNELDQIYKSQTRIILYLIICDEIIKAKNMKVKLKY